MKLYDFGILFFILLGMALCWGVYHDHIRDKSTFIEQPQQEEKPCDKSVGC